MNISLSTNWNPQTTVEGLNRSGISGERTKMPLNSKIRNNFFRFFDSKMKYNNLMVSKKGGSKFIETGDYNSFCATGSHIDYTVRVGRNCIIKDATKIEENSSLKNCVIEEDVTIG